MKFRFNGGLDCPEWVLAQISEISKIETLQYKALCCVLIEYLKEGKTEWTEFDCSNFHELPGMNANELRKMKAMVAALTFIFEKAVKYECSPEDFGAELLQLGLPSEHTDNTIEVYSREFEPLARIFAGRPIKASALEIISGEPSKGIGSEFYTLQTISASSTHQNFTISEEGLNYLKQGTVLFPHKPPFFH